MRIILLSLAAATFIIGVHQAMTVGIAASYWLIMLSLMFLFGTRLVGQKDMKDDETTLKPAPKRPKAK